MSKTLLLILTIFCTVSLGAFIACEHKLGALGLQPTLSSIQANVFSPRCALSGCHVPGGIGPMPLRNTGESFGSLVNVNSVERAELKRVNPNSAAESYMIKKLQGAADILFERMPLGGPFLSSEEINIIGTWISNGAQNN